MSVAMSAVVMSATIAKFTTTVNMSAIVAIATIVAMTAAIVAIAAIVAVSSIVAMSIVAMSIVAAVTAIVAVTIVTMAAPAPVADATWRCGGRVREVDRHLLALADGEACIDAVAVTIGDPPRGVGPRSRGEGYRSFRGHPLQ